MYDLIDRESLIMAIKGTASEVAGEIEYDKKLFDIMTRREEEIIELIKSQPKAVDLDGALNEIKHRANLSTTTFDRKMAFMEATWLLKGGKDGKTP